MAAGAPTEPARSVAAAAKPPTAILARTLFGAARPASATIATAVATAAEPASSVATAAESTSADASAADASTAHSAATTQRAVARLLDARGDQLARRERGAVPSVARRRLPQRQLPVARA